MENENLNEKNVDDVIEETTAQEIEDVIEEATAQEFEDVAEEVETATDDDVIGDEWQTETVEAVETEEQETLTEEELAVIAAANKKKRNLIIAICAAVVVVVAFAAYWVCRVEGIGEDTIVSNVLMENAGADAKNDNIKYENPIMAAVNTFTDKKDAVMTVGGKTVDKDVFECVTNMMGANCVYSLLQTGMLTNVADMNWDEKAFETKMNYTEYAKGLATQNVIPIYALVAEGEKRGITLTEDEEKEIADQIEELKEFYGDEFETALKQNGYANEVALAKVQKLQKLMEKTTADAEKDLSKYISNEELQKAAGDAEKVTVKHILIAFDEEGLGDVTDEKKAAAKTEAEEVLKKLNDGGDFDKLMAEYNDDPGATPEGYTFADDGTMVQQFTDASFALEIGETSGLVETSYGYHIIQRMERTFTIDDYIAYLSNNADVKIRKGNFSKVGVTADFDAIFAPAEE